MLLDKIYIITIFIGFLAFLICAVYKVLESYSENKGKKIINKEKEYYRESPNKNNTAAGVAFLLYDPFTQLKYMDQSNTLFNIIQATILELNLKGHVNIISLGEQQIKLKILEKDREDLKESQKIILEFIEELTDENKEIYMSDLKRKIRENKDRFKHEFGDIFVKVIAQEQKELENVTDDKSIFAENKIKIICTVVLLIISIAGLVQLTISTINGSQYISDYEKGIIKINPFGIVGITLLTIACIFLIILCIKQAINMLQTLKQLAQEGEYVDTVYLTYKGRKEREEWKKFKNYLKDYTLIKSYNVESIVIYKEYLVYATLFGISDNIQLQLGNDLFHTYLN